ncbi:MAG: FecR domain-containing protein [Pseudobdellovibrionaceae bacterium]
MGYDSQNPVGKAVDVEGGARVTHLDGTTEIVHAGTSIFQGDVVETDMDGAVNITFIDNTVFAISNDALMTIDEFVYNPDRHGEGAADISVDRGIFLYTSGFVGKEDHDDVHIKTPAGSIGIRGTTLSGHVPEDGAADGTTISLIEGAIVVQPNGGGEIYLDESRETVDFKGPDGAAQNIGVVDAAEFLDTYSDVRDVAPVLFKPVAEGHEGRLFIDKNGAVHNADAPQEIGVSSDQDVSEAQAAIAADGAIAAEPTEAVAKAAEAEAEAQAQEEVKADEAKTPPEVKLETSLESTDTKVNLQTETTTHLIAQSVALVGVSVLTDKPVLTSEIKPLLVAEARESKDVTTDIEVVKEAANHAPVAPLGSHIAFGFGVHEGATYTVDVSRFFYDVDGNDLNYGIASTLGSYMSAVINGDGLMTISIYSLDVLSLDDQTVSLQLYAEDEYAASNIMTLTFTAYNVDYTGTAAPETYTVTFANEVKDYAGGVDTITVSASATGAVIFGGADNDALTTRAGDSRLYGEEGEDTLTIDGTLSNAIVSGGLDNDIIHIISCNNSIGTMAFGGEGNDTFWVHEDTGGTPYALNAFQSGNLVMDGGSGVDILRFAGTDHANFKNLPAGSLIGIESIDLTTRTDSGVFSTTSNFESQIDFSTLFDATGGNTLFLKTEDTDQSVTLGTVIDYDTGHSLTDEGFTQRDDQVVDSQNYHVYYNAAQNQTLYIDADITLTT